MKNISITVLGYEGPLLRAYLRLFQWYGLKPDYLLLLVPERDVVTNQPMGTWLPESMRESYRVWVMDKRMHYWPRYLRRRHPDLMTIMCRVLTERFDLPDFLLQEGLVGPPEFKEFAHRFETCRFENWQDTQLQQKLLQCDTTSAVLYTGGGLLPREILNLPGLRFLHVHPGFLPFVRGSDGLLWSTLIRGQPGFSIFYMAPGIDTGDIIRAEEFPPLMFPLPNNMPNPDDIMLYRAIFALVDPVFRAILLSRLLLEGGDPAHLPCQPQDQNLGVNYTLMTDSLRSRALRLLFRP